MRHAARKDENHNQIEDVFRRLLADHVTDSSKWGDGAGDLFVSFGGESGPAFGCFVEIKRDSKSTFTPDQVKFRRVHPGLHFRIETVEQAIELCTQIRKRAGVSP